MDVDNIESLFVLLLAAALLVRVAEFGKKSDMGRPAQPEEISPAFVFLASPVMSSYVNGAILPVMGGPRG